MSYADGLLAKGERILHRNRQHPFVFIWGARFTILAIVLAVVLFWLGGNLAPGGISGSSRQILGWVTAVLFFGGVVVAIWTGLRYVNQEYVLTNRRVIQVEGVLNRNSTDSSLEKINDAVLSQSIFGRMFDFGDLTVLTASESGIDRMRMIRGPIAFKKAMLDAKHDYEVDMERAGWVPGPPIRDGAIPGAPSGPMPAGAAASPPPPASPVRADPDTVTRTLANLADLRDRGAITAEDYDAKKADLLARL
jgi:hypothetical protein